jgi:hypothetical protein
MTLSITRLDTVNGCVINKWWIGKDFEGNVFDPVEMNRPEVYQERQRKRRKNSVKNRIWGSHSGDYEEFWDITPCSPLKVNRRFGGTHRLHLQYRRIKETKPCLPPAFTHVFCLSYSSTLKAICSSETSADFQRTTRRYMPEGITLSQDGWCWGCGSN